MSSCTVCIEDITKFRPEIKCSFCGYTACVVCVQKFLLDTIADAHCMNPECKRGWDRDFTDSKLPPKFRKVTLKQHREQLLLTREKSLLPETLPIVEEQLRSKRNKQKRKELKEEESKLIEERKQIKQDKMDLKNIQGGVLYCEDREAFTEKLQPIRDRISRIRAEIREIIRDTYGGEKPKEERRQFIKPCSVNGCRGFLSTAWKCGLCETWTCPDCLVPKGKEKDAEHKCNPDNVESAKLIKSECRNCPKCGSSIYRIAGCSHMFCTQCHTGFDWKTQKVLTGAFANPHFFEWQRRNGQQPRNEPNLGACGEQFPGWMKISDICDRISPEMRGKDGPVERIYMLGSHLRDRLRGHLWISGNNTNQDLRIAYLKNEITELQWKRRLQQREKREAKNRSRRQIWEMFVETSIDLFHRLEKNRTPEMMVEIMQEFDALRDYLNKCLAKHTKQYDCINGKLNEKWVLVDCGKILARIMNTAEE